MPSQIMDNTKNRMEETVAAFSRELSTIRTGRANPSILNGIMVDYYGAMMPLNQIASIAVPEPQSLLIKPFDKSSLKDISKAILASSLGLTPNNDGETIRLNIPALTKERRTELSKQVRKTAESSKVGIRNIRRDAIDLLKKLDGISEDDVKGYQDDTQELTNDFTKKIDALAKEKEDEVKTI
ncbi:ribosome recycling factor [Mycoplasmatota bacterium WC44]